VNFAADADLVVSEAFEFFPNAPTTDLVDGGELALTANKTSNSPVLGRYIFGMTGGVTVGFEVPKLGEPPVTSNTPGPSWVSVDGGAPELSPGAGVWVQADGEQRPLTLTSDVSNRLRYESDGISVTFTGAPGTSAANGLVANPAGEIVCEICVALAAGQVIEAWMFSTPRLVAAHLTQDLPCQRFAIPVVAPLDGGGPISAGAHTLQLALPTASGMQAVNVGVTVGGPVPARVPAGEGPMVPVGLLAFGLLAAAGAVVAVRRQVVAG